MHLPLVQCRECRVTGWVTKLPATRGARPKVLSPRVKDGLKDIYGAFFGGDVDAVFLFPRAGADGPTSASESTDPGKAVRSLLCGTCGVLANDAGDRDEADDPADPSAHADSSKPNDICTCPGNALVKVYRPVVVTQRRASSRGAKPRLSKDCPYCNARDAMVVLGARAASLLAVALNQTVSSRHNDDPKVIAFSDNVQDAAHRAGFVSARTWSANMRAAIAQTVAAHDGSSLKELSEQVVARWRNHWRNASGDDDTTPDLARFVGEFIAPDRRWLNDFRKLEETGRLPRNSKLPALVERRMRWNTLAEFGQRSAIGRTLENTRTAAVGVDRATLDKACKTATVRLREELEDMRTAPGETARWLVLGIVRRMKDRGAILTDLTTGYLASGGNPFVLRSDNALPDFGTDRSTVPVFPRNQGHGQVGRGSTAWLRQQGQVLVSEVDAEGSGPRRPGPGSPRFRCRARDRAPGDGRRGTCAEGGDRQGTTRMGLGARPPLRRHGGCRGAKRRGPPAGRPPSGGEAVAGRAEPRLASPRRVRPSRSRSPHLVRAPLPRHAGPPHRRRRAHGALAAQRTRTP